MLYASIQTCMQTQYRQGVHKFIHTLHNKIIDYTSCIVYCKVAGIEQVSQLLKGKKYKTNGGRMKTNVARI